MDFVGVRYRHLLTGNLLAFLVKVFGFIESAMAARTAVLEVHCTDDVVRCKDCAVCATGDGWHVQCGMSGVVKVE